MTISNQFEYASFESDKTSKPNLYESKNGKSLLSHFYFILQIKTHEKKNDLFEQLHADTCTMLGNNICINQSRYTKTII